MPKVISSKPMTTNRRVTIPQVVADCLKLSTKEYVEFIEDDGKIYIRKAEA